jgi:hypothetical protein
MNEFWPLTFHSRSGVDRHIRLFREIEAESVFAFQDQGPEISGESF